MDGEVQRYDTVAATRKVYGSVVLVLARRQTRSSKVEAVAKVVLALAYLIVEDSLLPRKDGEVEYDCAVRENASVGVCPCRGVCRVDVEPVAEVEAAVADVCVDVVDRRGLLDRESEADDAVAAVNSVDRLSVCVCANRQRRGVNHEAVSGVELADCDTAAHVSLYRLVNGEVEGHDTVAARRCCEVQCVSVCSRN